MRGIVMIGFVEIDKFMDRHALKIGATLSFAICLGIGLLIWLTINPYNSGHPEPTMKQVSAPLTAKEADANLKRIEAAQAANRLRRERMKPLLHARIWDDDKPIHEHLGVSGKEFAVVLRRFQPVQSGYIADLSYAIRPDPKREVPTSVLHAVAEIIAAKETKR